MASLNSNTIAEGQSTTRPPFFDGTNYGYWKMRMQNFLIATDYQLWLVVENGRVILNTKENYTLEDIQMIERDAKAKNCLYCALSPLEFEKISSCDSAKEIWDKLKVTHEGTNQVKDTKINILTQEYESFTMKDDESISDMFGRFQKIISTLKNLGEEVEQPKQVKKILRSLPRSWMPKVTAIQEAKDLDKMKIEELMGSLMTHEILIKQKDRPSEDSKGKRVIALKANSNEERDDSEESESDEDEEIAMLSKKIKSLMRRKRGNSNNFKDKRKSVPTCYKCGKPGHMQNECNERIVENKKETKKYQSYSERRGGKKFDKKKKAMIAWDILENIIESDSSEEEKEEQHMAQFSNQSTSKLNEANNNDNRICFMALDEDEVTSSDENPDFEEMLNELYDDFISLKKKHAELRKKHTIALSENDQLKTENEKLKACTAESHEIDILKAENNALKTTLMDALTKLRPRRQTHKNNGRKSKSKPRQKMRQVWVPKSAISNDVITDPKVLQPKELKVSKFSATNPPGPILKWVPKSHN